ncbi:preprotein translocase [Corynebacterium sp. USCH3]|uniref:preprotein translocase n=1 Tax=Corynebacterium sp. USCH3 TaxID=3024840 RepID=UPI00309ABF2D
MFGLTIEKLIVIGFIAAVIIGPQRLPLYAEKLAAAIRNIRGFTEAARGRAERDFGVNSEVMDPAAWNRQWQRYDPRRIVRDALADEGSGAAPARETAGEESSPAPEPRYRWVVVGGSSGHPVRRRIVEPAQPVVDEPVAGAAGSPSVEP